MANREDDKQRAKDISELEEKHRRHVERVEIARGMKDKGTLHREAERALDTAEALRYLKDGDAPPGVTGRRILDALRERREAEQSGKSNEEANRSLRGVLGIG